MSPQPGRIMVHCGPKIVDVCDQLTVRRYLSAPNVAEVVRARESGCVVRVFLREEGGAANRKLKRRTAKQVVVEGQYGPPSCDQRESSRLGMEFEQALASGRVYALRGVIGSEA